MKNIYTTFKTFNNSDEMKKLTCYKEDMQRTCDIRPFSLEVSRGFTICTLVDND